MLDKLFSRSKKKPGGDGLPNPGFQFGRYSDNNKSVAKVDRWNEAESFFKEKKYPESLDAFFDYLKDDEIENVIYSRDGTKGTFELFQGSKIIRGTFNEEKFNAQVTLAIMHQPNVPVMRRLLEMNFALYYCRFALYDERIVMSFESDVQSANPSKLYYGLKELAIKSDKQDDLLVQDFTTLVAVDTEHIIPIPEEEKEIRLKYCRMWIQQVLESINGFDADKYSGGIAYLLLALAYRIDYLILPEGKLLLEIEKIVEIYFRKDDRPVTEKNQEMIESFQRLAAKDKEEFFPYLFRSKYTFSIVTPQNFKTISDSIYNANQNINWYRENKLAEIAAQISEYGISYCQFSYSLPRPVTEFFQLMMMANYSNYFKELGYKDDYYNIETGQYNKEPIIAKIEEINERWKPKYPEMKLKTEKIKFDNTAAFNQTLTTEIEYLNLETR